MTTTLTTDIKRALSAEFLKVKRSTVLVTVILLPVLIITMIVLVIPLVLTVAAPELNHDEAWMDLTTNMLETWHFMLLFIVPLITAMLANLDHSNDTWKHLFALPISPAAIYIAKFIMSFALFALSSLALLVTLVICGTLTSIIKPDALALDGAIPMGDMLGVMTMSYAASLLMIAIHIWAGLHWRGFSVPISAGMIAFLLMLTLSTTKIYRVYPWGLPVNFINQTGNLTGDWIFEHIGLTSIALSLIGSMVVILLCTRLEPRRDVQ
ncbi:MAG TPA: ABC transporter permease [Aggregatilineales bacterium]|nr:ABC transporter permease [Aggregatilineales bacterium]